MDSTDEQVEPVDVDVDVELTSEQSKGDKILDAAVEVPLASMNHEAIGESTAVAENPTTDASSLPILPEDGSSDANSPSDQEQSPSSVEVRKLDPRVSISDVAFAATPPQIQHDVIILLPAEVKPSETQTDTVDQPDLSQTSTASVKGWYRKQYHGGYRDRRTQVHYFHATAQTITPQELREQRAPSKNHRDTQTKLIKNRVTQAYRETGTQMTERGVYVSTGKDKIITPKRYVTAEEHEQWMINNVIRIQCFLRKCIAIRRVNEMMRMRNEEASAKAAKDARRRKLQEKKKHEDLEARLHPKTHKHFEKLLSGLEKWRIQETERINNAGHSEEDRLKELAELLDQEASLLQKIDRLKGVAAEGNRERAVFRKLDSMAAPKVWSTRSPTVQHVYVETPTTTRASELRNLYRALCVTSTTQLINVDERLQVLLHIKYTAKEFDCALTRDIVDLIDREGDLLARGRDAESLEGLRRRIATLFLQFIQTPEFNPEAATFQKDHATKQPGSGSHRTAVPSATHLRDQNAADVSTRRAADPVYAQLLNILRAREKAYIQQQSNNDDCDDDERTKIMSPMDLLQEIDLRYLIDTIWTGKSAVSGMSDLNQLMLCRWRKDEVLSPWNCVLLTLGEAQGHEKALKDDVAPEEVYAEGFVERVRQRHVIARRHFGQLADMMNLI
ncbi:hypothetical protein SeLEV6574_g04836 [Synchytrium endobioticum]|uniref:IQ motif and ubiquitin-like domain-containing protein n=1 Tax=Synchytrium endobioticum TaxID=286115 RepID=A0A507CXE3_9FUNG|nr:hypothetical protein SeLEV6574_g04836 [Synchytrium endobioticum]